MENIISKNEINFLNERISYIVEMIEKETDEMYKKYLEKLTLILLKTKTEIQKLDRDYVFNS